MNDDNREVRLERLRPAEINQELERSPLAFQPIGPLEYHGPHLPVGTDPLVATECALEACRRLGRGVVFPTLFWGTERERPDWMLESLGFERGDHVVGMDFPTATWQSHYAPEHLFGIVVASRLEMMIRGGYRVIVIVNGHGATNHLLTLERLSIHYSRTTPCRVTGIEPVPIEPPEGGFGGHADAWETSLMLAIQEKVSCGRPLVDLGALPERQVAIHYPEYSVVDGRGFSRHPDPDRIVHDDPRDACAKDGGRYLEEQVLRFTDFARAALARQGLS